MRLTQVCVRRGRGLAAMAVASTLLLADYSIRADNTAQSLPFGQNWTNTGLITTANDWSGVPGIIGYRGDALTGSTGTDPQTIVADGTGTPVNVIANSANPNTLTTGGIAEFDTLPDPTVAFQGSGTARAPFLLIHLNTTGQSGIQVSYNLRDVDGSADNSVQPVALQYRVGATGTFTNLPAGFVPDASSGPSLATLVTTVSVTLPAAADNQSLVEVRVITTDAVGSDEWIGVDDISVTSGVQPPTPPTGVGSAVPSTVLAGDTTLLKVAVTPGGNPISTGITVVADLGAIGGSTTQSFFDDGTNGDVTPSDNIFSFEATVAGATPVGPKALPFTVADAETRSSSGTISLTVASPTPTTTIHAIQGSGSSSPYAGQSVTTTGVVTGVAFNGFFLQTPDGQDDGDPLTSEGIFVFTSAPPTVATGDEAKVTGTVQEFIPSQDVNSPPVTEIGVPTVIVLSSGNPLPAPITLTAADTNPAGSIEQLERLEGMRVHVDTLTVVAPTQGNISEPNATSTTNGVFYGVLPGVARPFREPGLEVPDPLPSGAPPTVPRFDANPERVRVDSDRLVGSVAVEVTAGAVVTGLTGPLDYSFRSYTIATDPGTPPGVSGNIAAIPLVDPGPIQYRVGAFNIERFFDTVNDPGIGEPVLTATAFQNRLSKLSLAVRNLLRSPDILALEEVENLSTLQSVASKINADAVAAGDPNPGYTAYLEEGNDVGGIDVGFLVKSSISVVDVTQIGKDATYINPNNNQPELLNDRPSLVLRAEVPRDGAPSVPVTVIVNHLRSLSGVDDPVDGNRVRTKRRAQAEYLANHVQGRQVANPDERLVLVGDFNAFQFNDGFVDVMGTIKGTPAPASEVTLASPDLVNPDLVSLVDLVPSDQRYSFSFDGNAQVLDHALVSANVLGTLADVQYVRTDADFPESLRNDPTRPERLSDHDPVVATFNLPVATQTSLAASPNPSAFAETVTFTATVSSGGNPVSQGTVVFKEGAATLAGPIPLDASGQAAFSTSSLGPGPHTITADYSGTLQFDPSSGSVVQTVGNAPSATTLVSAPNPSGFGQPVTFTATVTAVGNPVTQGTVTFREGPTVLAGPIALDASGQASFSTAALGVGSHLITADYSGSGGFAPSSGSTTQTVAAGLSIADAFVKEGRRGTNTLSFVVTLSPAAGVPVTVNAATANGTALAGSDYVAFNSVVTFPPGSTQQSVTVIVDSDDLNEIDETFFVRLSGATGAAITDGEAIGTILNDDDLPALRVSDPVMREGNSGTTALTFMVKLSNPSSFPVSVSYATADGSAQAGSDYVAASGSLTFAPGTTSQPVVVNVKGDTLREPNEHFFLQLSNAINAAIVYGRGIAIILNDDPRPGP